MRTSHKVALAAAGIVLAAAATAAMQAGKPSAEAPAEAGEPPAGQAALTVTLVGLQPASFPIRVSANGNIAAWQEASIGAEASSLRLREVRVNVGDTVRRGQLLAVFAAETVEAELAQRRAAVAEADAAFVEAAANADRARMLQQSGALSAQLIQQYLTAERAAQARLDAARALEQTQRLRLAQTRITAPDDGIISARAATVGAVVPAGQELFRLIRGGRLEWRAEVAAAELARLRPGQPASVVLGGGERVRGRLRMLAPVIDIHTRNGLVYVDLPAGGSARAGMFARGEFDLGEEAVMALPQSAVLLREGFSHVMRVGLDARVRLTRVTAGRRYGERIEILDGLEVADRVVASGAAFLGDGDLVQVLGEMELPRPAALVSRRLEAEPATRGGGA